MHDVVLAEESHSITSKYERKIGNIYKEASFIRAKLMEKKVSISSSKDKEKIVERERWWSDLPQDILSLILTCLFAGDASIFHAICRSWQSITPAIRPLPPPIDSPLSQSPCLMILNDNICKFFHPIYNATYRMDIPELCDARIRVSNSGWLLVTQGECSVFFFNPFTREKIKLPDLPIVHAFPTACFYSPPTSSDCLVLGVTSWGSRHVEFAIIKRGEEQWTIKECENNEKFILSDCSPVLYNGKYYCLGGGENMGVLDLRDNRFDWRVHGSPVSPWSRNSVIQTFMVEHDGGMLAVFVSREARSVRVLRFNISKMSWETVQSLGDKMVYVSPGASYLETTMARGMGNKIYFPKFHGDNGVLYSLSTGKYHSFDGGYTSKRPFNLIEQRSCTWIKPMHTKDAADQEFMKW